jgi:hypothetical protein
VVVEALIETAGVIGELTVIVIVLLVAVGLVTQTTLLVITQFTVFPVTNALLVYVFVFVPTGDPFRYH